MHDNIKVVRFSFISVDVYLTILNNVQIDSLLIPIVERRVKQTIRKVKQ